MKQYWTITIVAQSEPDMDAIKRLLDLYWEDEDEQLAELVVGVRDHGTTDRPPTLISWQEADRASN